MQSHQGRFATEVRSLLLLSISAVLFDSGTMMRAQQSTDSFPLAVGNYWIYQCHVMEAVRYLGRGQMLPAKTIQKTWRSEITQIVYRKGGLEPIAAALFDSSPRPVAGDLSLPVCTNGGDFHCLGDKGAPNVLISVNSRSIYQISHWDSAFPDVLRRVQDPNDNLSDLLHYTQILDLPLALGKGWGEPFLSWHVIQREKNSLIGVRGAGATSNREGFVLETSDNTGNQRVTFVPGIGITHVVTESLFPRGDPSHWESEARLVEVHLNQTKAAGVR
jgi:hypothetical protein